MATSTPLDDLTENFFSCSICLEQFREPKQLPCLHRYCSHCLKALIESSDDETINCPLCTQQCCVPKNGVDGFKTDFHITGVLEFLQLQKSFEKDELKTCASCSKESKVSAYCFKCKDVLCGHCHLVHFNNKMFRDHQRHIMKIDKVEMKKLTMEKLSAMAEDPRCHVHIEKEAHLCCSACNNAPICVACIFTKHKGHDLCDVSDLAKREEELLTTKLAELNRFVQNESSLRQGIQTSATKLSANLEKTKNTLKNEYHQQAWKLMYKRHDSEAERVMGLKDIEERKKNEDLQASEKFQEELQRLKQKYKVMREANERKYATEAGEFTMKCDKTDTDLAKKEKMLQSSLERSMTEADTLAERQKHRLQEISDYCKQWNSRYQNITATSSSILSSSKWTYVQCIPDIRAACETLIEEMKTEFPDLKQMSDIKIGNIRKVVVKEDVTISEHKMSMVNLKVREDECSWIAGMTSLGGGIITTTGSLQGGPSYIDVFHGLQLTHTKLVKRGPNSYRYCSRLSACRIATVCTPDEIGIFDVSSFSYHKRYISDSYNNWQGGQYMKCVAVDPVKCHIIVGTGSRYLYVFDEQLNYSHVITLPKRVIGTNDIKVYIHRLLICDMKGKRAYITTLETTESKLIHEFSKPVIQGGDWTPFSVCSDKDGFIYMLWKANISGNCECLVAQYSQYGGELLKTRSVDASACCVTVSEMKGKETLVIATFKKGRLYTCGLIRK